MEYQRVHVPSEDNLVEAAVLETMAEMMELLDGLIVQLVGDD